MSFLNDEQRLEAIAQAKTCDYVRFSWPDLNGIPRGKTVPGRHVENFINTGIWEYTGTITMGPRTELPLIKEIEQWGFGNSQFLPASKLFDLTWAGDNKYKVGQFICEAYWPDGTQVAPAPRSVARKQLDRLAAMGYKLYSGFEVEFIVVDAKTKKPIFDGLDYGTDLILSKNSSWLFDIDKQLNSAGIDIGAMHLEYSPGQFEFAMCPKYGIDTCDDTYVLKQAMKEILAKYGLQPTFMTKPIKNDGGSSGFHFNHSLWDTTEGKSVFFDESKPLNMSDTMRYWVGGILKHIAPLTVLCSPTPNCYRRLHNPWTPDKADWGIDDRFTTIRVKNQSAGSALVENRLVSSACNPYIVLAATVAAGIDGIQNKIEPPPMDKHESNPTIPDFKTCINVLKGSVLAEALGAEFIDWWLKIKECELEKFGKHSMAEIKEEEIAQEREAYFEFI